MRTCGYRLKSGERSRAVCAYCGTRWDRRALYRDAAGLLTCPQEGRGRDAVTLTRDSVAQAKAWAQQKRTEPHDPGRLDNEAVERSVQVLYLLTEQDEFILTEADENLMGN